MTGKNDDIIDRTFQASSYSEVDSIIHNTFEKIHNTYDFGESSTSDQFDFNRKKLRKHREYTKKKEKLSRSNLEIENEKDFSKNTRIKEAKPEGMVPLKEVRKIRESRNLPVSAMCVQKDFNLKQDTSAEILAVTGPVIQCYIF